VWSDGTPVKHGLTRQAWARLPGRVERESIQLLFHVTHSVARNMFPFRQRPNRILKGVLVVCTLTILRNSNVFEELRFLKETRELSSFTSGNFARYGNLKSCTESNSERNVSIEKILNRGCVKAEFVRDIATMITDLYSAGNVRIFPRNGFLLGVIRHGGFLPNEGLDADLGVMYNDIVHVPNDFSVSSNAYSYSITKKKPGKWATFDGRDPWTSKEYQTESISIVRSDGKSFSASCFYPYGPYSSKMVFYPRYAVAGYNLDGALKEAKTWRSKGSSVRVLGRGNEDLDFSHGRVNLGNTFKSAWFSRLVPKPFYNTTILVPAGFEGVLKGCYGNTWRSVEKRISWESLPFRVDCHLEPLAVCQ